MDEVQDSREKNWSWFYDCMIDHYAGLIGPFALSVYMAFTRYSNNDTHSCFPSQETLAKQLSMSRATIKRAISTLKKHGLVKIERRTSKSGDPDSNVYHLLQPWGRVTQNPPNIETTPTNTHHDEEVGSTGTEVGSTGTEGRVTQNRGVGSVGATKYYSVELDSLNKKEETKEKDIFMSQTSPEGEVSDVSEREDLSIDEFIDGWNHICGEVGLPKITKRGRKNKELREKVKLRLREQPELSFWRDVFHAVANDPFHRGEGNRGWKCDLWHLVKNNSVAIRIYERHCNESVG